MKWLIALRYLVSPKSHSVINIIASVSTLAVLVPVAAMVVILSVFNGFEGLVCDMYAAVDAPVEVRAAEGGDIEVSDSLRTALAACEGVADVSMFVERQAVVRHRNRHAIVTVRGVDDNYNALLPIADHMTLGEATVRLGDIDRLLLGEGVAGALGIFSTAIDGVEVIAPEQGFAAVPTIRTEILPVAGLFMIDSRNDASLVLTSLRAAGRIFGCEGRASRIAVSLADGYSAERVCRNIEAVVEGVKATSREDKNSAFYALMRYEKWAIFFIALLVLVVASLSIIGSVIMLIIEKRDERVTLYALGADRGFLHGVFVRVGLLISGIGGVVGLVLGVAVVAVQQHLGLVKMPSGGFLIENYPVALQVGDLIVILFSFVAVAWAVSVAATRTMIKTI